MFNIDYHPGYHGAFTREQAEGAIPNGTRIVKQNSEPQDANQDDVPGLVLGSIKAPDMPDMPQYSGMIMYFIEWASAPKTAIGVMETKIRRAE